MRATQGEKLVQYTVQYKADSYQDPQTEGQEQLSPMGTSNCDARLQDQGYPCTSWLAFLVGQLPPATHSW